MTEQLWLFDDPVRFDQSSDAKQLNERLIEKLNRYIFGDDIFISYSRADAAIYAAGLANELVKLKFTCKIDQWGTQPGKELPRPLKRSIRSSALFVLVGTEEAAKSDPVKQEIVLFKKSGRMIVPINFNGVVRKAVWWSDVEGLYLSPENNDALRTGNPSAEIINRIEKTFKFTRRDQRLRRTSFIVALILLVLLAGTGVAIARARRERLNADAAIAESKQQKEIAEQQKGIADTATSNAEIQKQIANGKTEEARISDENARTQQGIAEQKTKEAQRQQSIAAKANESARVQQGIARVKSIEAIRQQKRAEERERQALSNQLASEAQVSMAASPARSLLFAIEALKVTDNYNEPPSPPALQALQQALSTAGGRALNGHTNNVREVLVSSDNHWAITEDEDSVIRLWDLYAKDPSTASILLPRSSGRIIGVSQNSRWLITNLEGSVTLWDMTAKDPSAVSYAFPGQDAGSAYLSISSNRRWLITSVPGGTMQVWDLNVNNPTASQPITRNGYMRWMKSVALSDDGRWIAAGDGESEISLWDLVDAGRTGPSLLIGSATEADRSGQVALHFSPDSRWLLVGYQSYADSDKSLIRLWDLTKAKLPLKPFNLLGHKKGFGSATFTPDSHWLVTIGWNGLNNSSPDETPLLWDLTSSDPTVEPYALRGHDSGITLAISSPDSHWLVTGSYDDTARLWDLSAKNPSDRPFVLLGHTSWVTTSAFSRDGKWLVTGSRDATLRLWHLDSKDPVQKSIILRGHEDGINKIALSPDSRLIVSSSDDHSAHLWNLSNPQVAAIPTTLHTSIGYGDSIIEPEFDTNYHWMVTQGRDQIVLWDLTSPNPTDDMKVQLDVKRTFIPSVTLSPKGRWLVISEDKLNRLYDLTLSKPLDAPVVLPGQQSVGTRVLFSPDERWLLTSEQGGTTYLCDLTKPNPTEASNPLRGYKGGLSGITHAIAFSDDSRWLATPGSEVGTAYLWDLNAATPTDNPRVLSGHQADVKHVAFSPDGRWLATSAWDVLDKVKDDMAVRLWNLESPNPEKEPLVLAGHKYAVTGLYFSPNGRWLVTANTTLLRNVNGNPTARLWDVTSADPSVHSYVLTAHVDRVMNVSFSPDGRWLATASNDDATVRLWNLTVANPTAKSEVLRGHKNPQGDHVWDIIFSRNSHWLATANYSDETARLWDMTRESPSKQPIPLNGHNKSIEDIAFSADNKWLVTVSSDKSARLWTLTADGKNIRSIILGGHDGSLMGVRFVPDNRQVITWGFDSTVRIWPLQIDELVERARLVANRNLYWVEWNQAQTGKKYQKTFSQLPVESSVIHGMLEQARLLTVNDNRKDALDVYRNLVSWATEANDADLCNSVAWNGSLDGFAETALPAGERAVKLRPDAGWMRDTRGLARALNGDYAGAVEDFKVYVEWTRQEGSYEKYGRKRERWIVELTAGRNPFNAAVLAELRDE